MKTYFILIAISILLSFSPALAEDNYCTDQKSWQEWDNLASKYPNDTDIQTLHSLRLGLCAKVERGDFTVQEAADIFEKARDTIIEKKKVKTTKDGEGIC